MLNDLVILFIPTNVICSLYSISITFFNILKVFSMDVNKILTLAHFILSLLDDSVNFNNSYQFIIKYHHIIILHIFYSLSIDAIFESIYPKNSIKIPIFPILLYFFIHIFLF